jgi:4-amino-4-deoxy-L-arabinose transferase-like glycosyltransferase
MRPRQLFLVFCACILIGLMLLHLLTVWSFPTLRAYDEPVLLAMAKAFPTTWRFESPVEYGELPVHAREPRLYLLFILWVQIFGPDWISARIFFLIIGILALGLIFLVSKALYGKSAALVSVITTASSVAFFIASHEIRMDIFLTLALTLSLLIYYRADKTNDPRWHFLTGLALMLSYEAHANSVIFVFAFGIYYLIRYGASTLRTRSLIPWAIIPGLLVGVLVLFMIHVVPSVEDFQRSVNFTNQERGFGIFSGNSPQIIIERARRDLLLYIASAPIEALLALVAIPVGLLNKSTRGIAIIYLFSLLGTVLFVPIYRLPYTSNVLPLLAIIAGGVLVGRGYRKPRLIAAGVVMSLLLAGTFWQVAPIMRENWNVRMVNQLSNLQSVIKPGESIISSPIVLLGVGFDRTLIATAVVGSLRRSQNITNVQAVQKLNPDFLINFNNEAPQYHLAEYGIITTPVLPATNPYLGQQFTRLISEAMVNGEIVVYKRK